MSGITAWRLLGLAATLSVAVPAVLGGDSLNQGLMSFKTGKYAEAAAEFQMLVESSPRYDFGYYMLGLSLLEMGKIAEARENIAHAIELEGGKFEYHNGLAKVYFTDRQYAQAVSALKTAEPLARTPEHRIALLSMRGRCYYELEMWADAAGDLEQARGIGPVQPTVLVTLGQAYYKLGHYDRAVPVLTDAVNAAPGYGSPLLLLAECLIRLGAQAAAPTEKDDYYRHALRLAEQLQRQEPGNYEAHNLVGRAALGAGELADAEQAFRFVLAQKPDHCYAQVNLGKTYIALERWKEAEDMLRQAATCAPRMQVIYESLAFALQKQDRLDEAIAIYEQAYEIKPTENVRRAIEICRQNLEVQKR